MKKSLIALSLAFLFLVAAQPSSMAKVFSDTSKHWAKDVIDYCSTAEFVSGFPNGTFQPDAPLTRAQMATIWARYNHFRTHKFSDIVKGQWHEQPIIMLYGTGVLNGVSETKFSPDVAVTREQMATIVARTFKLTKQNETTLNAFTDKDSISADMRNEVSAVVFYGIMSGSGGKFKPKEAVTRAEICQILKNIDDYHAAATPTSLR